MPDLLQITMFGEFSIAFGEQKINDKVVRSKKGWLLLAYLITFRHRDIAQNELIDLLWPENEVDNPANTLKTLLHRVRAILNMLGCDDAKTLILSHGGSYAWNTAFPCVVDTDAFEALYSQAYTSEIQPDAKQRLLLEAAAIYKGDFLPANTLDSWAMPINTYYRSKYMKIVADGANLLLARRDFEQLTVLCQKAITIDPYEEAPYYYLIKALTEGGDHQQALSYYDYVKDLFFTKFSINLSPEFTQLYKELIKFSNVVETDLQIIKTNLRETEVASGSFFCDFEIFKHIYQLESRSALRTGQVVYLCLFTALDRQGNIPKPALLDKAMERLRHTILQALRVGDVFCRYSPCQYLLMLPMTTLESGTLVIERLLDIFYRKSPNLGVIVKHSLQVVTPAYLQESASVIG